jgi:hypothetical protein
MTPSTDVFHTLGLVHWRTVERAYQCAKALYKLRHDGPYDGSYPDAADAVWRTAFAVRVEDAFAPLPPEELPAWRPHDITWAGVDPPPLDVVAAFEAMVLAGEVEAAYNYVCGTGHIYVTFSEIVCDHSSDFVHKDGRNVLAGNAVRIVRAVREPTTARGERYHVTVT